MIAPHLPPERSRPFGYTGAFPKWEWDGHVHVPDECESCSVVEERKARLS